MKNFVVLAVFSFLFVHVGSASIQAFEASFDLQSQREDDAQRNRINDLLKTGAPVEIEFVGNDRFSADQLLAQMKLFRESRSAGADQPYSAESLHDDLELVRFFLGTQGFLRAKLSKPLLDDSQKQSPKIKVQVTEGTRYVVGQLSVQGATVFTSAELIDLTGLKQGEILSAAKIQENVFSRITREYRNRGYRQPLVDFVPTFKEAYPNAPEGTADIVLEIGEKR